MVNEIHSNEYIKIFYLVITLNNQKYTLCFYDDLTILELETNADNKIYLPDNIDIITEINDYADKSVIHKKRIR